MRIVCWQTILMKYHSLFPLKIQKDVAKFVICYSRDFHTWYLQIEKSLQRIHQGMKNSMYTTAQSIENKVGGLSGWKDLLQAVGFRFEPSTNGLPPAVFFPQSDPAERLTQASASLQAILGLPHGSFVALAKFLASYEAGEAMIRVVSTITQIFGNFCFYR